MMIAWKFQSKKLAILAILTKTYVNSWLYCRYSLPSHLSKHLPRVLWWWCSLYISWNHSQLEVYPFEYIFSISQRLWIVYVLDAKICNSLGNCILLFKGLCFVRVIKKIVEILWAKKFLLIDTRNNSIGSIFYATRDYLESLMN